MSNLDQSAVKVRLRDIKRENRTWNSKVIMSTNDSYLSAMMPTTNLCQKVGIVQEVAPQAKDMELSVIFRYTFETISRSNGIRSQCRDGRMEMFLEYSLKYQQF